MGQKSDPCVVRAAGGLVTRLNGDGDTEVLLVHRPRYDDWSFPKGKCESADETYKQAALREVREETGFRCRLGAKLETVRYVDRRGRPKRVHYWEMSIRDGAFEVNDEVDRVKWLTVSRAADKLTHKRDRKLLATLPLLESSKAA